MKNVAFIFASALLLSLISCKKNKGEVEIPAIIFFLYGHDLSPLSGVKITVHRITNASTGQTDKLADLGETDLTGKLSWTPDENQLPKNYQFWCEKPGYETLVIPVGDPFQKNYSAELKQSSPVHSILIKDKNGGAVSDAEVKLVYFSSDYHTSIHLNTVGLTDANGKLSFVVDSNSLIWNKIYVFKKGYYLGEVFRAAGQVDYSIILGKVSTVQIHIKYQGKDTVKFDCFHLRPTPPSFVKNQLLYSSPLNYLDTVISYELESVQYPQTIRIWKLHPQERFSYNENYTGEKKEIEVVFKSDTAYHFKFFW